MITRASKQSETLEREKERDGNLNEELGEVPLFTLPGPTQSLWTNNVTYYRNTIGGSSKNNSKN